MKMFLVLIVWTFATVCQGQVEVNLVKGSDALQNRNYEEAIYYFDEVIKSDSNNEKALLLRSKANYSLKNYKLVINDCERILKINDKVTTEDDIDAIWNLGVTYNSLRKFNKAREYFNKTLILQPTNLSIYENIGYGFLEQNKYDLALEQFLKIVSIDNQSDKGYYGIGKVYYLKGEFENSIKAFDKAIEINPNYGIAFQNRGSAKLEIKDQEGCCKDWEKCLELGIIQIKPYLEEYCK